jgi:hypothetical protein
MTREPHPEHARARALVDTLARAAGMPSGQAALAHLESLRPDSAEMKLIGEAIAQSIQKTPTPDDANPPGPKAPAEDP